MSLRLILNLSVTIHTSRIHAYHIFRYTRLYNLNTFTYIVIAFLPHRGLPLVAALQTSFSFASRLLPGTALPVPLLLIAGASRSCSDSAVLHQAVRTEGKYFLISFLFRYIHQLRVYTSYPLSSIHSMHAAPNLSSASRFAL